ncbi:ubiquinol-cytochrome C chaperone family protein [Mesorhizobium sp. RMAD-H1]|uniref:ubiquinol-cytochrome C chaperone family protein n=1 Tax=Mesorhizobium sp. RMAD-H1 TaxID=2587065 RepID=UPI0016216041|nr:ubiquinol-cytochrome C chaperone family protein [Mesorhizobium sp. RMAD-H1]MBB2970474.1 cytochrome b pre-mRNA-processing protein 3 [Mesorhizobium sp. RMAD-H1]
MILKLFSRKAKANEAITLGLYEAIVAAARQTCFYARFSVPDIPLGRYEMLSLHVFLAMHRLKGDNPALRAISQEIADEFFKDVDHSLRELGIGDQGVPKRMKKLARMFYGRIAAYEAAFAAETQEAFAAALTRNVRPDLEFWPGAAPLAAYAFEARDGLAALSDEELARGDIRFPDAERLALSQTA